jgi:hypothetical protein
MVWVKLFKPTWGRIAIFIILFAAISLLDQVFLFFPESPLTYNVFGAGALPFIAYLLIIPYIVSCVVPAFFIREFRHAKIHEFVGKHRKKPTIEGMIDTMEDYEQLQERYARSLKKPFQKPEEKPKPKKAKKSRTRRRR